jgi:NTE family protein
MPKLPNTGEKSDKNNEKASSSKEKAYFCPRPTHLPDVRTINLAIQGGGSHGAFAWGVLDRLLEDGRLHVEGISGTSAGSMNAVVLAYGLLKGGREGARQQLHNFWWNLSQAGQIYNLSQQTPWEKFWFGKNMENSIGHMTFEAMTHCFSPYQFNPLDVNPVKEVLLANVDFAELQKCQVTKLFLSTTNARTGQVRVFGTDEITADVVLASACLPFIFKAVEIDGEYYWDGGYTGNPSLFPFFYHVESSDILIIHINPIERPAPPIMATEIFNRITEISFNSGLLHEYRAIAFVQKMIDEKWIKDEFIKKFKYILLHSISTDNALSDLTAATKSSSDWDFLCMLRNRGQAHAGEWLARHFDKVGVQSSFDLKSELVGVRKYHSSTNGPKD